MADQQEPMNPHIKKHWETGSGTKQDPEISFLVPLCVEHLWKNEMTIKVAYKGAKKLGATKMRVRHIVHNTNRGINAKGEAMRFRTDWYITVYVWVPEIGYWQHGDIFYRPRPNGDCVLMTDQQRQRRDRDGKGIELWAYPEDESRKTLTRAQRNERLAQALEDGRWCKLIVYKEKKSQQADQLDDIDDGNYDDETDTASTPNGDLAVGGDSYVGGSMKTTGSIEIGGNSRVESDSRVGGNLKVGQNSYAGGDLVVGSSTKSLKSWYNPTWGPSKGSANE